MSSLKALLPESAGRLAVLIVMATLLGGCASGSGGAGGRYALSRDAYPDRHTDVSKVPDAVPQVEPLSRSGNQSTYQVLGKRYHVLSSSEGYSQTGRASFYGQKFQGYDTANGEQYDMYTMSAAHRTLPLPTFARVTNLANDRSVIVRVNDRGPFHDDRLIDLSYAAASRLDMLGDGTARVRVTAIDPRQWQARHNNNQQVAARSEASPGASRAQTPARREADLSSGETSTPVPGSSDQGSAVYLQVAALGSDASAQALRDKLETRLSRPVRVTRHAAMHRVQVGPLDDPIMVESVRSELHEAGYDQLHRVTGSD
ncbi:septal ring lytic transglycosylase RlpA family protein [Kushneria phyllosphaerae]|uniref:Endolytic peptidoglycan transglycosylase RlpA n=1 Tax=Kushneria phyllosphaerae TaxID=2100822 RepID=A0A2R8CK97_9GAMM|nr:septal ring lytic transglycosylase RlpA family protein [Kushneria phyllosphaerae]SPJ33242.1 Endolytic peptidoglycan transglycosylase RlpA [Kushneria phyllosphaerae]